MTTVRPLKRLGVVGFWAMTMTGVNACLDNGLKPIAPDTTPPLAQLVSPVDTLYDLDGDKLLDLRVVWLDSGSPIDLASVSVRSLNGVNGSATAATNLLSVWTVEELDSSGLSLRETLDNLLHGGPNLLELTLADTAGNVLTDTVTFSLPHGALYRTIVSGSTGATPANGLALCPDDNRLYMTAGRSIIVMDPDSLTVITTTTDPFAGDDLSTPLCVPGDPILYVTQWVQRFNRLTTTWLPRATGSFQSIAVAQSRARPDTIFVGETTSGTIGVIGRTQGARIGQLLAISPFNEFVFDMVVLGGDTKMYVTRLADGGIMVLDPVKDSVTKRISVGGVDTWPGLGRTDALALSADERRLYAAVIDGLYPSVAEIDTQLDSAVRFLPPFSGGVGIDLALSPGEKRMFVTTADNGAESENVLVDVPNWVVLQTFPRTRAPGAPRWDGDVVFHPSGKTVFVIRNRDVDVYLIRE